MVFVFVPAIGTKLGISLELLAITPVAMPPTILGLCKILLNDDGLRRAFTFTLFAARFFLTVIRNRNTPVLRHSHCCSFADVPAARRYLDDDSILCNESCRIRNTLRFVPPSSI
jgi:hypothetical protein